MTYRDVPVEAEEPKEVYYAPCDVIPMKPRSWKTLDQLSYDVFFRHRKRVGKGAETGTGVMPDCDDGDRTLASELAESEDGDLDLDLDPWEGLSED